MRAVLRDNRRWAPPRLLALLAAVSLLSAPGAAAPSSERAASSSERAEASADAEVRRWEHVVLVRVEGRRPHAIGRAETAALAAGGAILERVRTDSSQAHADWRLLVRTREPGLIGSVLRSIRTVPGVMGASAVRLPETPTFPGGPSFLSSYTAGLGEEDDPRVLVRHDVPPVLDKRDLVETAPLPAGPSVGNDGVGGFTLNISELIKRARFASWRKREERMKNAYLPILPSDGEGSDTASRE